MRSAFIRISAAALLILGALSTQASAATQQYPYQYPHRYERGGYERRAFEYGERDGYVKGTDDVRRHRHADVNRQRWYRSADRDYDRRYGSRDEYRAEYRRGFQRGYERAYREGYREDWR
jgi:hypothetical protein